MCKHATAPLSETPQHSTSLTGRLAKSSRVSTKKFQTQSTTVQNDISTDATYWFSLGSEERARTLLILYRTITTAIDVMSRFTVGSNLTTCMTAALYSSFHSTVPRQCTLLCTDSVQNCTPICTVLTAIPSISFRGGINFSRLYHLIYFPSVL